MLLNGKIFKVKKLNGHIWTQVQPVRVGQPQLSRRAASAGESVHAVELAVVHYRVLDAARFRYRTEVSQDDSNKVVNH